MNRFIEISVTKNLSLLDKNYNPVTDSTPVRIPVEYLATIWADINLEYTELVDGGSIKSMLTRTAEAEALRMKYVMVTALVEGLSVQYHEDFVNMLQELGYSVSLDLNDKEKYTKQLSRIMTQAKNLLVQIKAKEGEVVKAPAPEDGEEKDPESSLDEWHNNMIAIREDVGYHVKTEDITVYEYTQMRKNLIKKLEYNLSKARALNKNGRG